LQKVSGFIAQDRIAAGTSCHIGIAMKNDEPWSESLRAAGKNLTLLFCGLF
jgi:hypothetical protein